MTTYRQLRLAARPIGEIKDSDFELIEAPVPEPGDNEFLVEVTHISIDPAMRGWLNAGRSYIPPVEVGEVMRALTLGRVLASRHERFAEGDLVQGTFGVQEHALSDGAGVQKLSTDGGVSPATYLGVLGITGLTAYFGLLDVGRLQEGETVLVSGAAGAVGTAVGQIAKIKGARVVGIAGGPEKCRMLVEDLGFDAAIDYKGGDLHGDLRKHTPDHVDVFFDNVGGEVLNQGLTRLGRGARVVICGAVSQYNNTEAMTGPSNYMSLLVNRASMIGFVIFDYASRYGEAIAEMSGWLGEGRLKNVEHTVQGDIGSFPCTLAKLFTGQNTGKLVLELPVTDAFILGGVRTPVGRYGGALSHIRTDDLLGLTMVAACERAGVELDRIEDIAAGCVNPAHEGMGDIARWAALAAGFPDSVPAATVNRFCASSLTCTIQIAHAIRADELGVGLAGGVESMSRSGWALMKGDAPFSPRGPVFMLDTMWAGAGGPPNPALLARDAYIEMIRTAQNVADRYELTREEIDAFALRSHTRAAAARESGRFAEEIHPVEIPGTRRQPAWTFERDESIRDDTTAEGLAALPPQPNTTQMTAGNSSPLNDGASAVVLASGAVAEELGIEPLARVLGSGTYALDPQVMGIAPAFAIPMALKRAGLTPQEIDVWEVHEAFSAQALGVLRELPRQLDGFEVPDERLNPNGGAVAIGHPFGSSGTRYVLTLATELRLREARYGVLGVCVGSGQGVALVLENPAAR